LQVAHWHTRFADLLTDHPAVEAELRSIVTEIEGNLPAVKVSNQSMVAGRDINIRADRNGLAVGVIHGDMMLPDPPVPGSASA
jgi:hypothetical protein